MRGTDEASGSLFSYVELEQRIPAHHPLRKIRQVVNHALTSLTADFDAVCVDFGRPSIAPERRIRASLIQILLSIFTKNRDRLLNTEMSRKVMAVSSGKRSPGPLSDPPQPGPSRSEAASVG